MTDKIKSHELHEKLASDVREEMLASMYGVADDEGPQEQPIQLRLAGKATIVNIDGQQVAIPRIEYVEAMEAGLRALKVENQKLRAHIRKLELMHHRDTNIAGSKVKTLESDLRRELDRKMDLR